MYVKSLVYIMWPIIGQKIYEKKNYLSMGQKYDNTNSDDMLKIPILLRSMGFKSIRNIEWQTNQLIHAYLRESSLQYYVKQ